MRFRLICQMGLYKNLLYISLKKVAVCILLLKTFGRLLLIEKTNVYLRLFNGYHNNSQ